MNYYCIWCCKTSCEGTTKDEADTFVVCSTCKAEVREAMRQLPQAPKNPPPVSNATNMLAF